MGGGGGSLHLPNDHLMVLIFSDDRREGGGRLWDVVLL